MTRALVLLLAAQAGCWIPANAIAGGSSDWIEIPNVAKPPEEVVRLAREILSRQGYRLLPDSPGALGLESDWDVHLSSHWRDGFRTKVEVAVDAAGAGRARVRIRDRREFNDNGKNPMNPEAATWVGASIDDKHQRLMGEPAMRVRQLLRVKLEGQP